MTPDYVPTLPELQSYSDKALPGLSFANGDTADLFFYPEGSSFTPDQKLVARCATGHDEFTRNAAFLAACVNYVRKVVLAPRLRPTDSHVLGIVEAGLANSEDFGEPRPTEWVNGYRAALEGVLMNFPQWGYGPDDAEDPGKRPILFDVEAARSDEWCWYVVDHPNGSGFDPRSVIREGESRIYFESARAIISELGLVEPDNLEAVLNRDFVEAASDDEMDKANVVIAVPGFEVEIDGRDVSRADDAVWISAWVRIPNAADHQPDDFAEDDVNPVARKARIL